MIKALEEYGVSKGLTHHAIALEIQELLNSGNYKHKNLSDYYTFAFVRNPFDWLVSLFFWLTQNKDHDMSEFAKEIGFDGFVHYLDKPEKETRLFKHGSGWIFKRPLKTFVTDEDGNIIVDFVGKVENIQEDYDHVCKQIGIENKLSHYNKSVHPPYRDCYTEETKKIVEEIYKDDLEFFGYEF